MVLDSHLPAVASLTRPSSVCGHSGVSFLIRVPVILDSGSTPITSFNLITSSQDVVPNIVTLGVSTYEIRASTYDLGGHTTQSITRVIEFL